MYTSTYSVEDDKLRLYVEAWLDKDEYTPIKDAGFRSAPKQAESAGVRGLFFATWSPGRQDLCVELAGSIEAEETTLAERAEMRAERFDGYQANRLRDSDSFYNAATVISERFAGGQPILVGHHSERSARRDQQRMDNAMRKAIEATETANYWSYRASGVERHANRKADPAVRARRIKELLKSLRDYQRRINQNWRNLVLWEKIEKKAGTDDFFKTVEVYAGSHIHAPYEVSHNGEKLSLWSALSDGKMTAAEVVEACIRVYLWSTENPYHLRWIQHLLNRLSYERAELGEVARFEGELTPVILQTFAREQGADKPKAKETCVGFVLGSLVALPLQINPAGDMKEDGHLELPVDGWRDLMQACGHTVIIKEKRAGKKQACPLINPSKEQAEALQAVWNADSLAKTYGASSEIREMPQKYYSANSKGDYGMFSSVTLDQYGRKIWNIYRDVERGAVPTCRVRISHGGKMYSADRMVVITDKPQKDLPTFEDKPMTVEA